MKWRQWGLAVAAGAIGFAVSWGAWHLKVDHDTLHAMLNYMVQLQQQSARPAPAATPAEPATRAK